MTHPALDKYYRILLNTCKRELVTTTNDARYFDIFRSLLNRIQQEKNINSTTFYAYVVNEKPTELSQELREYVNKMKADSQKNEADFDERTDPERPKESEFQDD